MYGLYLQHSFLSEGYTLPKLLLRLKDQLKSTQSQEEVKLGQFLLHLVATLLLDLDLLIFPSQLIFKITLVALGTG